MEKDNNHNNSADEDIKENKKLKAFMESIGLIKALGFISMVSLVIVLVSINLYLKSDRSKYDLYRPGQSKVQEPETETNHANIESNQDLPVYKDEISQIQKEMTSAVAGQSTKQNFKESDLSDENLIPPDVNVLQ
jgi:hypothetical protein